MITDEELDALRSIADRIRHEAEQSYYGTYNGGDPRLFSPDPECATAEELEQHARDCAEWEAGNCIDCGPSHVPLDAPTDKEPDATVRLGDGTGWKTVHHYGFGMVTATDPVLLQLAQDLDDLTDRIRNAS